MKDLIKKHLHIITEQSSASRLNRLADAVVNANRLEHGAMIHHLANTIYVYTLDTTDPSDAQSTLISPTLHKHFSKIVQTDLNSGIPGIIYSNETHKVAHIIIQRFLAHNIKFNPNTDRLVSVAWGVILSHLKDMEDPRKKELWLKKRELIAKMKKPIREQNQDSNLDQIADALIDDMKIDDGLLIHHLANILFHYKLDTSDPSDAQATFGEIGRFNTKLNHISTEPLDLDKTKKVAQIIIRRFLNHGIDYDPNIERLSSIGWDILMTHWRAMQDPRKKELWLKKRELIAKMKKPLREQNQRGVLDRMADRLISKYQVGDGAMIHHLANTIYIFRLDFWGGSRPQELHNMVGHLGQLKDKIEEIYSNVMDANDVLRIAKIIVERFLNYGPDYNGEREHLPAVCKKIVDDHIISMHDVYKNRMKKEKLIDKIKKKSIQEQNQPMTTSDIVDALIEKYRLPKGSKVHHLAHLIHLFQLNYTPDHENEIPDADEETFEERDVSIGKPKALSSDLNKINGGVVDDVIMGIVVKEIVMTFLEYITDYDPTTPLPVTAKKIVDHHRWYVNDLERKKHTKDQLISRLRRTLNEQDAGDLYDLIVHYFQPIYSGGEIEALAEFISTYNIDIPLSNQSFDRAYRNLLGIHSENRPDRRLPQKSDVIRAIRTVVRRFKEFIAADDEITSEDLIEAANQVLQRHEDGVEKRHRIAASKRALKKKLEQRDREYKEKQRPLDREKHLSRIKPGDYDIPTSEFSKTNDNPLDKWPVAEQKNPWLSPGHNHLDQLYNLILDKFDPKVSTPEPDAKNADLFNEEFYAMCNFIVSYDIHSIEKMGGVVSDLSQIFAQAHPDEPPIKKDVVLRTIKELIDNFKSLLRSIFGYDRENWDILAHAIDFLWAADPQNKERYDQAWKKHMIRQKIQQHLKNKPQSEK